MIQNTTLITSHKEKLSVKTYKVRFSPVDDNLDLSFLPGQFMSIEVARNIRRSYSISNNPSGVKYLETLVDVSPGGPGSQFFEALKEGDEAKMIFPLGRFVYKPSEIKPVIFFATGTGLAPFGSMIEYALREDKTKRRVHLNLGFRYEEDVFYVQELKNLAEAFPNFSYRLLVSRPTETWQGERGRINEAIEEDLQGEKDVEVYICGGSAMILDTEKKLIDYGVTKEQIYYERYY